MPKKSKQRYSPYEVLISNVGRPDLSTLLQNTYNLYLHGSRVWSDVFLNMTGGAKPEYIDQKSLFTVSYPVVNDDGEYKVNDDGEMVMEEKLIPAEVLLFSHWFSLESPDYAPAKYIVPNDQVWQRYCDYLGKEIDPVWAKAIQHSITSTADVTDIKVWVDRKQSFQDWKSESGITDEVIDYWFHSDFPFHVKEIAAPVHNRSILCQFFGRGPKSDWGKLQLVIRQLQSLCNLTSEQFISQAKQVISNASDKRLFGGRKNKLEIILDGSWEESVPEEQRMQDIADALEELLERSEQRFKFPDGTWRNSFENYLGQRIGIKYNGISCQRRNQYAEMANQALERMKSYKTNFLRQLAERLQLINRPKLCTTQLHMLLNEWMDEYLGLFETRKGVPHLHERALNGKEEVCLRWRKAKPDGWVEAVDEAEKQTTKRFGYNDLFKFLAVRCCQYPDAPWLKILKDWRIDHETDYKIKTMRVPYFRHISLEALAHINFERKTKKEKGKKNTQPNRPQWSINISPDLPSPTEITLELYNGTDFVLVKVPFKGKRFVEEIAVGNNPGTIPGIRRHKLVAEMLGSDIKQIAPTAKVKGAKLIWDGCWHGHTDIPRFKISIETVLDLNVPLPSDIVAMPHARFFAGDLGQRDINVWSVWERCEPPTDKSVDFYVDGDDFYRCLTGNGLIYWFKLIDSGNIHDYHKINEEGSLEGKRFDRFNPNIQNPVNNDETTMWANWQSRSIIYADNPCPANLGGKFGFNDSICYLLKRWQNRIIRKAKKESGTKDKEAQTPFVQKVLDSRPLIEAYNQIFSGRGPGKPRRVAAGGMSYSRIETISNLINVFKTYLSWREDKEIEWRLDFLRQKINGLVLDRIRNMASRSASKAMEFKCQVFIAENLAIQGNSGSSRFMNRRNAKWSPKKNLEWLRMVANSHELYFMQVNPAGTSMVDFATGRWSPRKSKISLGELNSEKWRKIITLYSHTNHPDKDTSERYVVYHAAWMRFLKERNLSSFDELLAYSKLHPDEKALVPDVYGHVIETQSQNDPLNADQNACRNIAHRGIKYLYGLCEKKSPKKGKKKKSAPKIRIRKGLRRKPAN